MIKISLDEGYAYDLLAISQIKKDKNILNSDKNFNLIQEDIISQIGKSLHSSIINSTEFKNLLIANAETFEAVEKARYSFITAKEVDDCNMKRYNAKIKLQNKFFSNSSVLEIKT